MPLELKHVDFGDGDELALLSALGHVGSEFNKAVHPTRTYEEELAGSKERWPALYGYEAWHTLKVVDTATGKAVATSRWVLPPTLRTHLPALTGVPEGMELPPRKPPTTLDREFLGRLGDALDPIQKKCIGDEISLLYLDSMVTLPEYRRQGAASLMLKWAADFADEHGILSTMDVCGDVTSICGKFGWEDKGTAEVVSGAGTVLKFTVLVREPKKSSSEEA
ncbi:hypothetical protein NLG97_g9963 [Lecanicillium saksenae]|uniref:Uncharacterized protein n=1 Tax=Lecanicillium saksenae TaxID=468837 RepID=A0ACC1QHS6_9HYPO|nr:hypothetical protein NLG97_g9963 [Lecanicillium saksenae]